MGGAYALNGQLVDVVVMLAFGVIGWRMEKAKLPLAAFVIGFVLAPVAEENLCAGIDGERRKLRAAVDAAFVPGDANRRGGVIASQE